MYGYVLVSSSLSWHSLLRSYSDSKFLVWTCSAPVVCEGKGHEVRAVGEIFPVGRRDLTGSGTVWGSGPHLHHILLIFTHKATQAPPLSALSFWQSTSGSLQSFLTAPCLFCSLFCLCQPGARQPLYLGGVMGSAAQCSDAVLSPMVSGFSMAPAIWGKNIKSSNEQSVLMSAAARFPAPRLLWDVDGWFN